MTAVHKSGDESAVADPHDGDPWVSLNAAVDIAGKAKTTVQAAALDGKVRHQRVAGRRFFHRDDLAALRNTEVGDDEE